LESIRLAATDRAVTVTLDFPAVARTILELRPDTTTVALVLGGSQLEQFWAKAIEKELATFGDRLRVLPSGMLASSRCASAWPRSPAFRRVSLHVRRRGGRRPARGRARAGRDPESSSAPVFGIFDDQLGHGIVGDRSTCARWVP
jgi:hypothetical protein